MKLLKWIGVLSVFVLAVGCDQGSQSRSSQQGQGQQNQGNAKLSATGRESNQSQEADNTGRNVRDRSGETVTPGDQGNNDADLGMTRQIRRSINSNDQLSTLAKNVKVITANGKVTLRGPVNSEQEK